MKPKSSLAGDVSAQVWIQFLLRVTTGVTSILLARHLSQTDNGLLGTAWQYATFAQFLTDLGFNTVLVREAAGANEARRRTLIWTSLRLRMSLAIAIAVLVLVASFVVQNPQMVFLLRFLVFPIMIVTVFIYCAVCWFTPALIALENVGILDALREPSSATAVAKRLGLARQKVNDLLRELENATTPSVLMPPTCTKS